jgi:hypothetical protein
VLTDDTKKQLYDQGNDYADISKHMQQQNQQQGGNPFANVQQQGFQFRWGG